MKFVVKDAQGKSFDVDAPEGYTLDKVAQYATEKLGFKIKSVEHVEDAESRLSEDIGKIRKEFKDYESRISDLESEVAALRDDRRNVAEELAAERAAHEETRKLRMKALGNAEASVRDALQRTLEGERKAREEAEKRAAVAHSVVVENKLPETVRTGWRLTVVRDANGFVRAMDAEPK